MVHMHKCPLKQYNIVGCWHKIDSLSSSLDRKTNTFIKSSGHYFTNNYLHDLLNMGHVLNRK